MLMMVYNTWITGFLDSDHNPDVSILFPTLLGPLERANLNHWTTYVNIITDI
jgi:hypothetical protein